MSSLLRQVLHQLPIKHVISSPYHSKSQGELEWYCADTHHDWDDGIPLVLFAVCEVVQESPGFSPAD